MCVCVFRFVCGLMSVCKTAPETKEEVPSKTFKINSKDPNGRKQKLPDKSILGKRINKNVKM